MKKLIPYLLRLGLPAILFFNVHTADAQTDLSLKLPVDPKVKIGKLSNGLTYYIRQNKKPQQKVELRLVVNAGAINEDDEQQGLAHMAEHMAFNGTKRFKKNELISFLQNIGVGFGSDLNAYTSFDETVYILPVPTDKPANLEKGFQVLEDWAHQVTYIDQDIDDERAVILEESRMGKGANDRMFRKIYPKLFKGSKYANRLPIGLDSIIKNFQYKSIRKFYSDWYRPDLMAVIVVGDITPLAAEEMVKKHFSQLKNPTDERLRTTIEVPAYLSSDAIVVTDKEATRYSIGINYPAFKSPPSATLSDYRSDLLESLFTSIFNQRLQEKTQEENPPFISASADFSSYARGYKSFNLSAGSGTGDAIKALYSLAEETERIKLFGVTAGELERAKKVLLSNYEQAYNNRQKNESGNYAEEYINNFLQQEPIPGIEKEFEYVKKLLPAIPLEDLNAFAGKVSNEKNRFVFIMGPEPRGAQVLTDSADVLAVVTQAEHSALKPYEENIIASELIEKMPTVGKVVNRKKDMVLGTTELKLSNGVTVILKPTDFKNDEILMGSVRAGGKNNYGLADKYNVEYATAIVGAMGIGSFSPSDLRKALAGKSVNLNPSLTDVSEGVSGSAAVKDLETLFKLTYLYYTQPRKDSALFRSFVQKNKSQFANINANPQAVFIDSLYSALYNGNPLAPVVVPNAANFDKIDLDRSLEIYRERFGDANGMNFAFAGSFTELQIVPLIEKYIASLPATQKKFSYTDNKLRPATGIKTLEVKKGKEQKSIIVAFYTGEIPYSQDLELKMEALTEILNIRIIEELREKIQGIYGGGTNVSIEKAPYANFSFMVQLPCGPDKVDTLLKALRNEFALIIKNGPSQSNLDKVKKEWREEYKTSTKENGTWVNQILSTKFPGSDPKRFVDYLQYIQKLTVKDVQDAAKIALGGNNQLTGILMPEDASGEVK